MKICIISDSHDNRDLLLKAVTLASSHDIQAIMHCGDVVAPSTLLSIIQFGIPIHVIHGNNTGDLFTMGQVASRENSPIQFYGMDADITLNNTRIFMVHYPHYAEGMATTGKWDLVLYGHTHQYKITKITNIKGTETTMINPGSVGGLDSPSGYVICNLETMAIDHYLVD